MVARSWALDVVMVLAIAVNLRALLGMDARWAFTEQRIGLAQRLLLEAWFGWCALLGWSLRSSRWQSSMPRDRAA